ncbi:hypothetical protein MGYG_00200 [Nannizzia gypsea CBS 118893]|uniref:Uncharacterized protein n=1 Tax=Arthroderma gypseum (strain ATCC MYA-4604 / CBS 118893) TaxID=535722 RepID=E5R3N3_ARTGP|nr:hypothetical protein MGYG_00200 [Nannizzia gypsea CBS 118893]EFQ97157.1 hypothetical protein MGYG_00200 [Nannizzia gypsea CBS 118893]
MLHMLLRETSGKVKGTEVVADRKLATSIVTEEWILVSDIGLLQWRVSNLYSLGMNRLSILYGVLVGTSTWAMFLLAQHYQRDHPQGCQWRPKAAYLRASHCLRGEQEICSAEDETCMDHG